jgi:ABC-2 type transport system ATP-binding protein
VHGLEQQGNEVRFEVEPDDLDAVIGHLHRLGISALTCTPPTLEQLFLQHYRHGAEGATPRVDAAVGAGLRGNGGGGE